MAKVMLRAAVPLVLTVAVLAGPAAADGTTHDHDQALARLEALLQHQQEQIQMLEHQVAAASRADADAARVDEAMMRQQIRSILSEQEFRESLMPSMLQAGYDNGFFIRSSDDLFLMKVNAGMQFRYTYYNTRARNRYLSPRLDRHDRSGFDVQRLRLAFGGHAYSQDLSYYIEFKADAPDGYDVVASEAYANYRIADEFQLRAGILGVVATRESTVHGLNQQSIDRSLAHTVFGFGTSVGVQFWGQLADKRLVYNLGVYNGLSDGENTYWGRTVTTDPAENDGNPAIVFRLVWHALGEDPESDFATQSDRARREVPALDIGFHYAFNDNYGDRAGNTRLPFPRRSVLPGGFGLTDDSGIQINQFGLDAGFKFMGFSATGEYIIRVVDPRRAGRTPFTPWWLLTGDSSTVAQHGAYVQLGWFLPVPGLEDKLEAVTRVGGISTLAGDREGTWEYMLGLNYYFDEKVKLQTDLTYIYEVPITSSYASLANVNDNALIFRMQLQVAF
jgi:hypothetical protein